MGQTHLAAGLATALLLTQSHTFSACAAVVAGGALGGVLADNDTLHTANALTNQLGALGLTTAALILDGVFHLGLCREAAANPERTILGGVAFAVLYFLGCRSAHRTFTHSLLALALYSAAFACLLPQAGVAFSVAYASHLLLDLLNKRTVQLLYPLRRGFCLRLCYADGLLNRILCLSGAALSSLLLVIGIVRAALA